MKLWKIVQFVICWFLGVLTINKLWMPYLLRVTEQTDYLVHGAIWPIIIWTICLTITIGIINTNE